MVSEIAHCRYVRMLPPNLTAGVPSPGQKGQLSLDLYTYGDIRAYTYKMTF